MGSTTDLSKNYVIRFFSESENENIVKKVGGLIRDGLGLNFQFENVERKKGRPNIPGIIIVSCKSHEDKDNVISNKAKLKTIQIFSQVYTEHDKPKKADNMKQILEC